MEYILEIYEPGRTRDVWITFTSDSPFIAISKGEILNPGTWDGSQSR
jgi:hypothetical protein